MKKVIFPLLFLGLGFAGGFFFPHPDNMLSPAPATSHQIRQSGYHYINPLLECELGSDLSVNTEIGSLKDRLQTEIDQLHTNSSLKHVSVYFRDLNNGPWFGIEEDAHFTPASLLKTPVMLAYLKQADLDPTLLTHKLLYNAQQIPQESPPIGLAPLSPQAEYGVEELIRRMIISSDNQAFQMLTHYLNYETIQQVHKDLGIALPTDSEDFITVREYASIFRVLYNSSYLSRHSSELALSILANADYHDGLVAGVDPKIEVAHKYGVRHGTDNIDQLHDCGIVYYPNHPYLLCLMTKGTDFPTLTRTLSTLSRTIFDSIKAKYPL